MRPVDEATRYCAQCRVEVHDLGALTQAKARALLDERGDARLCVRYRSDRHGRIRFADSTEGAWGWVGLAAVASVIAMLGCASHESVLLTIDDESPELSQTRWLEPPAYQPERAPEPESPPVVIEGPPKPVEQPCFSRTVDPVFEVPDLSPPTLTIDLLDIESAGSQLMGTTFTVEVSGDAVVSERSTRRRGNRTKTAERRRIRAPRGKRRSQGG